MLQIAMAGLVTGNFKREKSCFILMRLEYIKICDFVTSNGMPMTGACWTSLYFVLKSFMPTTVCHERFARVVTPIS